MAIRYLGTYVGEASGELCAKLQEVSRLLDCPFDGLCVHRLPRLPALGPFRVAVSTGPSGSGKSTLARELFGPGCVLILAVSPFWLRARESPLLQAATTGVNAAAAGLVVAACVTLTFGAVKCPADAAVALAVAGLSSVLGVSAPKSVGIGGALGALLAYAGVARVPYHA